ncbi:MAG TPA: hypothetical protein VFO16_24315 [Pseudonocardiaceae bacterium]|nr:hypothetical protein [Pseudonocardiaceae bacterium]
MAAVRALVVLSTMMLGMSMIGILSGFPGAPGAPERGGVTDSAVTVAGTGEFAGLRVTVSQTRDLINQVVAVSWTGAQPTRPFAGKFGINYMQIMQCWGDDPKGPERTQCQYGAASTRLPEAGPWVKSRQLTYPFLDQKETLRLPANSPDVASVPFWAVGGDKPTGPATGDRSDFFDSLSTNEIPVASTHGDGTGLEFFEVQTVRQAPGLGCGEPVVTDGAPTGRPCWLVIVPRGSTEADGSVKPSDGGRLLESSPLSESNWENRIAVRLEFLPVGQACPIGRPERSVIGHELMTDAVSSWQPALCEGGGSLFNYIQLPDEVARNRAAGAAPGLALVTNPIPPSQPPPENPPLYAPVGLSGLAIAFNIEHSVAPDAPAADQELNGQRFGAMKLTPRLVAKLLTQSYRFSVLAAPPPDPNPFRALKDNPAGLASDPEFLDLNPEYKGFTGPGQELPDALVQLGTSDLTALLWNWVNADPDAHAFLTGTPDPSGMVVNPANQGLALPVSGFPRNDEVCADYRVSDRATLRECTLDHHPYTRDMHDAGRSASRGDTQEQGHTLIDERLKRLPPQNPGKRALLAVVDTATAARYSLPVAALRNTAGEFVIPSATSFLAAVAAMKPSAVPGVLATDPATGDPAAYPLTALSYAVTTPATLDTAARTDYAGFLRFAVGPGQQPGVAPGQLPSGMVPLPGALRAQTTAAAAAILAPAAIPPASSPSPGPGSPAAVGAPGRPAAAAGTRATSPGGLANPSSPAATPAARDPASHTGSPAAPAGHVAQQPLTESRRTPSLPAPLRVGLVLLAVLICGALAAMAAPAMPLLGAVLARRARKEVTPTEL